MKKNNNVTKLMSSLALAGALVSSANANDAPESFPMGGYTTAGENTPLYFGFDNEDGTNVVVNVINGPTNGVIENVSGNTGVYRANTNYSGFDEFSFYVSDSQGLKSTNSATFLVKPNNVSAVIDKLSRTNCVSVIEAKVQPSIDGQRITKVYRNTDLSSTNWVHIGNISPTNYVANGLVEASFIDNNSANLDNAFYRLQTVNP